MLAHYVVPGATGPLSVSHADDLKRRMGGRVGHLVLEHLEGLAQYVGHRCAELVRHPLEPLAIRGVEVHLHRFFDASLGSHDIMSCHH